MKYHISPTTGNPNICRAAVGKCPFASTEEHYASREEARAGYEATQTGVLFTTATAQAPRGVRELAQLAKTTTEEALLRQIVTEGSESALKNLSSNPEASADVLYAAYVAAEKESTQIALGKHSNFPLMQLKGEHFEERFRTATPREKTELAKSRTITDAHFEALEAAGKLDYYSYQLTMLKSDNYLTPAFVDKVTATSDSLQRAALQGGKLSLRKIAEAGPHAFNSSDVSSLHRRYRPALAGWAATHGHEQVGAELARDPEATEETLRTLGNAGVALREVYSHGATPQHLRKQLEKNPALQTWLKFKAIEEETGEKPLDALKLRTLSEESTRRGYAKVELALDQAYIRKHDLSDDEIVELFREEGYNARAVYSRANGIFTGERDTGG